MVERRTGLVFDRIALWDGLEEAITFSIGYMECFHSRGQHLCKFMKQKKAFA